MDTNVLEMLSEVLMQHYEFTVCLSWIAYWGNPSKVEFWDQWLQR